MKVLALAYYPVDKKDNIVDPNVDFGALSTLRSYLTLQKAGNLHKFIKDWTKRQIQMGIRSINEASRFRAYKNSSAKPSVNLSLAAIYNFYDPLPYDNTIHRDGKYFMDSMPLLNGVAVCDWVDNKNVREVWIMKVTNRLDWVHPEFVLSGKYTPRPSDWNRDVVPQCKNSYNVVIHDIDRWDLFMHVWYHSLEAKMRLIDDVLYRKFQGPCAGNGNYSCYPQGNPNQFLLSRCGNCHNAPNARKEYDIVNTTPSNSDCRDWNPDGNGKLGTGFGEIAPVSCADWGCLGDHTIESNETVNYIIWNLQNMPGWGNTITYKGQKLRDWWDIYGDWDGVKSRAETFIQPKQN